MLFLDVMFRFSAVGLLFMLALFILVTQRRSLRGGLLILLAISLIGLLIGSAPRELGLDRDLRFICRLIDVPNTIIVWLFAKSLVDDNFRMDWKHWLISGLYCVPLWIARIDAQGYFDIVTGLHFDLLNLYSLGLFVYLLIFIFRGAEDDLIEPRRKFRFYFVFALILLTSMAIASEFVLANAGTRSMISFKILVILPLLIGAYFWILKVRDNHFAFDGKKEEAEFKNKPSLSFQETELFTALEKEMSANKAWREPDMTIPKLAKRFAVTEHKLRALINQKLGYRNFSAYLNGYRIAAIKSAFAAQETKHLPILTIALDHGFNSLPPFNRAFKLSEGMTPRVYRSKLENSS